MQSQAAVTYEVVQHTSLPTCLMSKKHVIQANYEILDNSDLCQYITYTVWFLWWVGGWVLAGIKWQLFMGVLFLCHLIHVLHDIMVNMDIAGEEPR